MSIQDAAEFTGLSWDTVKGIHKTHLRRKYKSFNLKKVRHIAIDEVYLGKKRKYITLVLDLRTGRVIHIGKGKGKDALKGFWRRLKRSKAKIEAVATDMASGYIAAVLEQLPKADLVLDHFHLVKWFNDKLSLLRRQLYQQATMMEKAVLKGSRWLLLKAPENLKAHQDRKKDERVRLQAALELNQPLAIAYYMKERLRLLFQCADIQLACHCRRVVLAGTSCNCIFCCRNNDWSQDDIYGSGRRQSRACAYRDPPCPSERHW